MMNGTINIKIKKYEGTVISKGQERKKKKKNKKRKKKNWNYCRKDKSTENRRKEGMN